MDLSGKNVIYVGGFGGIGYASCEILLKNNIQNLYIFDVENDTEKLARLQELQQNAKVAFIKLDLTITADIEKCFETAFNELGRIDVVINGSGIMNEHTIERTIQINLLGVIHGSLAALRYMDKSQGGYGGVIVNVSSLVALDTYGAYAVYAASKYGVNGFTRAMADPFYYERTNVSFITICPSTTETPMLEGLRKNSVTTFNEKPPLPVSLQNTQSAQECGENIVVAIKKSENGAVWILSAGKMIEYKYQNVPNIEN